MKGDCCQMVDVTESTKNFIKFTVTLLPLCMVAMAVKMTCKYVGMASRCDSNFFCIVSLHA